MTNPSATITPDGQLCCACGNNPSKWGFFPYGEYKGYVREVESSPFAACQQCYAIIAISTLTIVGYWHPCRRARWY
jgi:hypothetical protein